MQTLRSNQPAAFILVLAMGSLIGCSEDGGGGVPISWSLNYGDWTQTTPEFNGRGCDNQPSDYTANPAVPGDRRNPLRSARPSGPSPTSKPAV